MGVEYDYIPDYPEQAGTTLSYVQFRSKDRMQALLRGLAAGPQMAEDMLLDLQLSGTLDASTGDAQDAWGDLVGLSRMGLSSERYSGFIAAQAIANAGSGLHDELVAAGLAMGADQVYTYTLPYQASVLIELTAYADWTDGELRAARRVFESARQGGIGPGPGEGMVIGPYGTFTLDDDDFGLDAGLLAKTF